MSQISNITELDSGLKKLNLSTIRGCYSDEADLARKESLSYELYLQELVVRECEERSRKRIARYLRESKLPLEKNLDSFDRSRLPSRINGLVNTLLDGSFLERCENILAFGNPGSGKTHLLCAIAQELINRDKRILFIQCSMLVQSLLVAKRELELPKTLRKFLRFDAILIDDIGYVQQSREEMEVLFTLLAHFYEQRSVMITSNLPFSKWEKIFKDPMTTAAVIDRLVHHSVILEVNLNSYRLQRAKRQGREKEKPQPPVTVG